MPWSAAATALGTAGLGVFGDVLGGIFGSSAQKQANATNIKLQREQQAWQERMANTSWQRGKEDMIKAGFNPMLAFSQGGADTPNVQPAQVQPVDASARAASSAGDKMMQLINLSTAKSMADKAHYDAKKSQYDAEWRAMETDEPARTAWGRNLQTGVETLQEGLNKLRAEASSARTTANQLEEALALQREGDRLLNRMAAANLPEAEAAAKMWNDLGEIGKEAGMIQQWVKGASQIIQMFSDRKTTITRQ